MHRHGSRFRPATLLAGAVLAATASVAAAATLTMQPSANPVALGEQLTITFSPKIVSQNDQLTFDFGDGTSTVKVTFSPSCGIFGGCATVTHTYARLGTFTIHGSGTVGGEVTNGTLDILVTAGQDRFVLAAAHAPGINQTVWRSDLELHNPSVGTAVVELALLERQKDNSNPATRQVEVPSGSSVRLADVLGTEFTHQGTAALRLSPKSGSVLVTSRTYNQGAEGTYGQYVPAVELSQAVQASKSARLIQLSHDPTLASGFRTNIGLLNPAPIDIQVELTFYEASGASLGATTVDLLPFEFRQLDKAFEMVTTNVVDDGFVRLRGITPEAVFFTYASVVDNLTGDPTLIPALVP